MTGELTDLTVRAFVAAVASPEQPVPAGGSVAALTASACAGLLGLVCGVLQRRESDAALADAQATAERLQHTALQLVEEDAASFRAFLDAQQGDAARVKNQAVERMSAAPLQIARTCAEIIELSRTVEARARGPMLADVHAARNLAGAALAAALDIARENLSLLDADEGRHALRAEITRLAASYY